MSNPLIRCIMPTCNRETIALRAVGAFRAQNYVNAYLVVLNSGGNYGAYANDRVVECHMPYAKSYTVGHIRNMVIEESYGYQQSPDYIAHFDDDDLSAPDRLTRQLEHIQKTGKLVTGFYDMPMYDAKNDKVWIYSDPAKRYILGTSLFYKREAWESVKFPDRTPEDNLWRKQVGGENCEPQSVFREDGTPMMVQTVHGGNASARIVANSARFKEASVDLDKEVRRILKNA